MYVTVETGFRVNTLTVSESTDTVDVCLTTLGTPAVDTIINVTVMYGSAEEAGERKKKLRVFFNCACGQNIKTAYVPVYKVYRTSNKRHSNKK
jgi:hypothetical protein